MPGAEIGHLMCQAQKALGNRSLLKRAVHNVRTVWAHPRGGHPHPPQLQARKFPLAPKKRFWKIGVPETREGLVGGPPPTSQVGPSPSLPGQPCTMSILGRRSWRRSFLSIRSLFGSMIIDILTASSTPFNALCPPHLMFKHSTALAVPRLAQIEVKMVTITHGKKKVQ